MSRKASWMIPAVVGYILASQAALAQSSSGTISGRVLDTSGDSVANATVTLTKKDTREARTIATGNGGDFTVTSLQPGPYPKGGIAGIQGAGAD